MRKRLLITALTVCVGILLLGQQAFAAGGRFIDDNDTVILQGNTHPLARSRALHQISLASASLPMEKMILSLQVSADKRAALDKFLQDQKDPSSPEYHHWLTPEEFGAKFGPSPADVAAVTGWLTSHGFTIDEVAGSRTWINFSGDVSKVEQTFKTQIKMVQVGQKIYHANASDPSIPRGLVDLVSGVVTLHNIPRTPKNNGAKLFASNQAVPNYTSGSSHYLAPGDFAAIYNLKPLYSAGVDGTGQSIAIVGRTNPSASNWSSFRSKMGLAANTVQVIVNGTNPGDLGAGEDTEANLDVEWAGAVAKNATIKFVTSKSTNTTDGVDLSAQYIVKNNLAPVMSMSFGSCESDMGSTENSFYNNLWSQAAAQGITVLVAAGDSGAAGCSDAGASNGSGKAVNGLASTPYNIAVGGTQFNDKSGTYWNSVNATDQTSALGYIPEIAWNESGTVAGGSGLWATGGGVSMLYSKPSWQVAPGVPADGKRDVPDVSLAAAGHDAYLIYTNGSLGAVGGTSASAPAFAGVMALVVQKTGQRQGNANPILYQLANNQYAKGGPAVFHDVTASNNSVPGVTGYACGTGFDLATGLGSVDANALVTNWSGAAKPQPEFTLAAIPTATIMAGKSGTVPVRVTVANGFSSSVSLTISGLTTGITAGISPASFAAPGSGSATVTIAVASTVAAGSRTLTVTATGGGVSHSQSFTLTVATPPPAPDFGITVSVTQPMIQGSGGAINVSTSGATGFNSAVALSVTGLPTGVTAIFAPASIAAPGTGKSVLTLTVPASVSAGSYTITIKASGGGYTHSVSVPISIVSGTIFSSSFTDGWYQSAVTGTAGRWGIVSGSGSYPTASPHSGSTMAQFNSYTAASGSQTRMLNNVRYLLNYGKSATLSFWVYHDTGRPTNNDKIQAQVSTNGTSWANVGPAVSRYSSTAGWTQVTIDLSSFIGQYVMFGFLGTSGAGYNMYMDDVQLSVK